MKIVKVPELNCWIVAHYSTSFEDEDVPLLVAFRTKKEAEEFKRENRPSLLSKIKLFFER